MFLKSFSEGFGNIFHVFFDRQQCQETHITEMLVMQENHSFCDVLYTSQTTKTKQKTKKFFNKSVANDRFRGIPIWSRFWKGLGRSWASSGRSWPALGRFLAVQNQAFCQH